MAFWTSGCGRIELELSEEQAAACSHPGPCDSDVRALSNDPAVAAQLAKVDPNTLRAELRGYGAWDDIELADHGRNLQRLLWIAACDISEGVH